MHGLTALERELLSCVERLTEASKESARELTSSGEETRTELAGLRSSVDRVAQITALLGRSVERLDAGFRAAQRQHGTGAEGEEAPRDTLSEDREDTHALRH